MAHNSVVAKLGTRLKQTVKDLNRHWTAVGTTVIILVFLMSVLANAVQLLSAFPVEASVSVSLPVLVFLVLAGLSAFIAIAVQISAEPGTVMKRPGITPLTNVWVDRRRGELYFGEIRNVLLRVETIREVLDSVVSFTENATEVRGRLHGIGFRIGQSFAVDFYSISNAARKSRKLSEIIDEWCVYDVEAGWGKFNFEPGTSPFKGTIAVRSNFLIAPPDDDSPSDVREEGLLCSFMEGYISGILGVFARIIDPTNAWNVSVSERVCGRRKATTSCRFAFTIIEGE